MRPCSGQGLRSRSGLLEGLEWVAWVSPIFVYLLLTKVSGIPILDRRALSKWGDDPEYQRYRERVPAIFPSLWEIGTLLHRLNRVPFEHIRIWLFAVQGGKRRFDRKVILPTIHYSLASQGWGACCSGTLSGIRPPNHLRKSWKRFYHVYFDDFSLLSDEGFLVVSERDVSLRVTQNFPLRCTSSPRRIFAYPGQTSHHQ